MAAPTVPAMPLAWLGLGLGLGLGSGTRAARPHSRPRRAARAAAEGRAVGLVAVATAVAAAVAALASMRPSLTKTNRNQSLHSAEANGGRTRRAACKSGGRRAWGGDSARNV
eukprot:scaffold59854_cov43-Phaeocystis_antarctica.AAC.1